MQFFLLKMLNGMVNSHDLTLWYTTLVKSKHLSRPFKVCNTVLRPFYDRLLDYLIIVQSIPNPYR